MALSQSKVEMEVGDLLSRRRKVSNFLESNTDMMSYGPMEVRAHPHDGYLAVYDPDGGLHEVEIPSEEVVVAVEEKIREAWEQWLEAL